MRTANIRWKRYNKRTVPLLSDKVVNICEVKYSQDEYNLNKEEYDKISKRKNAFIQETGLRHTPWITMITTEGIAQGKYSEMIQSQVRLDELFEI